MGFARGSGSGDLPKTASLESITWKPRLLNSVEIVGKPEVELHFAADADGRTGYAPKWEILDVVNFVGARAL